MTTTEPDENLATDETILGDRWYHIVAVRDGTTQALYVDGTLSKSRTCSPDPINFECGDNIPRIPRATGIRGASNPINFAGGDNKVNIGRYTTTSIGSPRYHFEGKLDDIRIYGRALSPEEIRQLADANTPTALSHWKFDEGNGTAAFDSASENDGTVHGAGWVSGVLDGALHFDGIDDYVALPDNSPVWLPQNDFTLSVWVYFERPPGDGEVILDLGFGDTSLCQSGYAITRSVDAGKLYFKMTTTEPDEDLATDEAIPADRWYHIVAVRDGTTQALYVDGALSKSRTCSLDPINFACGDNKVNIGRYTTTMGSPRYHFEGKLDDIRIYGRALSPEEIHRLVDPNTPIPLSRWKFDEGIGTAAFDSAGENDGIVCGAQWTSGQINYALDFDGTDDCVDCGASDSLNVTGDITVSAWINTSHTSVFQSIVAKTDGTGARNNPYVLRTTTDSLAPRIAFVRANASQHQQVTSTDDTTLDEWHFVAATVADDYGVIYIDGQPCGTHHFTITPTSNDKPLLIGAKDDGAHFNGSIDDVRIYDKALSGDEIDRLYQAGLAEPNAVPLPTPLFADPESGDYHLKSERGRWDPNSQSWVQDEVTSPCIDAGDPASDWLAEPWPNGRRINMGAYGGTPQASLSLSDAGCFPIDHPDYYEWLEAGKPLCWCYPRQCHGDADGQMEQVGFFQSPVFSNDLQVLISAWKKLDSALLPDGVCANFDHQKQQVGFFEYQVFTGDLDILVLYWKKLQNEVPEDCLDRSTNGTR